MKRHLYNPNSKVIITDAHLPEKSEIVTEYFNSGYPMTVYADKLTDELAFYSKASFVQLRIGKMDCTLVIDDRVLIF